MSFKPTVMQQKAIDTEGNVLVSAAAGSGKTAVLVERVIRKLTDPVSPVSADRLLIVTFTNAAAAEMRSRIEKRLYEEIQKRPDDIGLLKQKHLIASADICTIDSFCIKLVRENFEKCGVEPDFKVCDGSQLSMQSKNIMSQLLQEYFAEDNDDFKKLLELTGCEYDEQNLADTIENIYTYSRQLPFPENFINGLITPYVSEFVEGNAWYDKAFEYAENQLKSANKSLAKMAEAAVGVGKNGDKYIDYAETAAQVINEVCEALKCRDWDNFYNVIHSVSLKNVPSGDKEDGYATAFKVQKKAVSDILGELCSVFEVDRKKTQENIRQYTGAVVLLNKIINDYAQNVFSAHKTENNLTFSDTEQLALNLLCKYEDGAMVMREDAQELYSRYDEVLVDEFQDVNDLQNMLFYVLSNREEKLFIVGDVKQSIYGFRGSNPDNFLSKKNSYIPVETADEGSAKKIVLSDNFRSRRDVCETVNFFFSHLMAGQHGKLVYNEEERLNAGAEFPKSDAPAAELLVVDRADTEDDLSLLESEAKAVANYILSVMDEGAVITDGDTLRAAKYSDFVILLEKTKNKASIIADALKNAGIPVSVNSGDFLKTVEIATVMALLQVIDNPQNDVPLLCVMMSSIFGFTAEDMADIRACHINGNLYSAVVFAANGENRKAADFLEKLAEFRRKAAVLPIDRLISYLLNSTDMLNQMSARADGAMRRANLFSLVKFAADFAQNGRGSIYGFIKYMESLPPSSFKVSGTGVENSVKIMTMHQSKGLQFPICIVANLSSKINNTDSISRILYSEKLGIAFNYYDEALCKNIKMMGHRFISRQATAKNIEERLRLLYVAMTRAQDRLCLVCSCKNAENKLAKMAESVESEFPHISEKYLEKSQSMGEWILSASLLHPDCEKLRNMADFYFEPTPAAAPLNLRLVNCFIQETELKESQSTTEISADEEKAAQICRNIAYEYHSEKLRFLQAKASVSQIANSAESEQFAFTEKPAFMLKDGLSAAGRGTAMHNVMQFIKMQKDIDISAEIERLVEWQFITEQQAASLDKVALAKFFESVLYQRILASKNVRREMRFLTEVPAKRFDSTLSGNAENANVIVQGAVDLCFEECDGIVVLDFKTDRVQNAKQLADCYGEQLEIYAAACEKIFSKPVKEKIIYSFALSDSISL